MGDIRSIPLCDISENLWVIKLQFKSVIYNVTIPYLLYLQHALISANILGHISQLSNAKS